MNPHRLAYRPAAAAAVAFLAACASREPSPTAEPDQDDAPAVESGDLGLLVTLVDAARTIERVTAQYARFLEAVESAGGGAPLPAPDALRDTMRLGTRMGFYREELMLPGEFAADLEAPACAGVLLPRGGNPAFVASIPLLDGGASPPRGGPRGIPGVFTWRRTGDRLAMGYFGAEPVDLAGLPGVELSSDDDLTFRLWGVPGAERARRALLGWAGELRGSGQVYMVEELVFAAASAMLDLLSGVDTLQAGLRVGDPGQPALALHAELRPLAGSPMAGVFPDEPPTEDFPFLGAVPAAVASFAVSRKAPGDDVLVEVVADTVERLFAVFVSTARADLARHVTGLGAAAGDILRLLDGRWLDASWTGDKDEASGPAPGSTELFLLAAVGMLPERTMVLGVRDGAAALEAARRACEEIRALGEFLDEMFGGPLDVGCRREPGGEAGDSIDVLSLRERIEPGDLEAGRRPWSADVYFAAGEERLVMVTGENWQDRLAWALGDSAPDGGLAADPAFAALRSRAPSGATSLARFDLASLLLAPMAGADEPPPAGMPAVPIDVWTAMQDGAAVLRVESSAELAGEAAAVFARLADMGVLW